MNHFEEKSGIVASETPWGRWYQTLEEVVLEVSVPVGTPPREVRCELAPRTLLVKVVGTTIIQGKLWGTVISEESTWTLEDRRVLRVVLVKSHREAGSCWPSLLEGAFPADPITLDNMQKKLTLERFQNENPGFDFSGAEISGNYQGGGPDLSQLG
ncbi:nudC domain-containing protein 2 isoform X2 [Petromyzon marinus]|uniref:NudC domain-containing protein 2 n=1 Tax=Petromyzon marinus TaxID=7757 RepID=A0AAJ7XEG7_PETMA|nr:nudC domain-containing protein 2 [Petromyzon marinus]